MKNALYQIISEYRVLHYDEFPILFSGLNAAGERIVGSLVKETDNGQMTYFHSIVSENEFVQFLQGNTSYLELMKNAKRIYFLSKNTKGQVSNARTLKFQVVPTEILPLPSAFCPPVELYSLA